MGIFALRFILPLPTLAHSVVQLCLTLCDLTDYTHQAPLSMGFSRQEHWSGLPFPPLGDLPNSEIKFTSIAAGRFFLYHWGAWNVRSMNQGKFSSVQFSSVAKSCPTLCDPMNHSTPGLPVHHHLPEFTQTHVRVHGAIQPSHPRSSSSPPAPNPSQHQSPFQWKKKR